MGSPNWWPADTFFMHLATSLLAEASFLRHLGVQFQINTRKKHCEKFLSRREKHVVHWLGDLFDLESSE